MEYLILEQGTNKIVIRTLCVFEFSYIYIPRLFITPYYADVVAGN